MTNYITKKAVQRLWMIRRLKEMGANNEELLDVYCKQIRSVFKYAALVWHPGLTVANTLSIERVQKACLAIILGQRYISYSNALQLASLDRLDTRREATALCPLHPEYCTPYPLRLRQILGMRHPGYTACHVTSAGH